MKARMMMKTMMTKMRKTKRKMNRKAQRKTKVVTHQRKAKRASVDDLIGRNND